MAAARRCDRQGARGADPAARRQVPRLPGRLPPRRGRRAQQPNRSGGLRGHGDLERRATLYPTLEGAPTTNSSSERRLRIFEFDLRSRSYTGRSWQYHLESPANSIGDLTQLEHGLLVIERDNGQGATALFKKIYRLDLNRVAADGFLVKQPIVDLLTISDPAGISLPARPGDLGIGTTFSFPFQTIESVLPLDDGRLLVANDNNFPFSSGRTPTSRTTTSSVVIQVPALDG